MCLVRSSADDFVYDVSTNSKGSIGCCNTFWQGQTSFIIRHHKEKVTSICNSSVIIAPVFALWRPRYIKGYLWKTMPFYVISNMLIISVVFFFILFLPHTTKGKKDLFTYMKMGSDTYRSRTVLRYFCSHGLTYT